MSPNTGPPVSVKVALRHGTKWVLLLNERGEWELPGGRIESADVSLRDAARRECVEELGVEVEVGDLVDSWLFEVVPDHHVVIVCFAGRVLHRGANFRVSNEHREYGLFSTHELASLDLPDGYRSCCVAVNDSGAPATGVASDVDERFK